MFRFNRLMRPLRQVFRPNAPLKSPAVMYSGGAGARGHRKVLPGELMRSVVRLTCESSANGGICDVYLVGAVPYAPETFETYKDLSHEREKACQEIRGVINYLKPEVVFLGLDQSLSHDLKPNQMLRRILGSFFDREVITEFQVAYQQAQKYGGNVVLGDRPGEITMGRACPTSLVLRSLHYLIPNVLMNLADFAINNGCDKRLGYNSSEEKKIFVDERNQYMSATLLKVARQHNSVVAVVGKCHLPGIQKYWKQPIEVEELLSVTWPFVYVVAVSVIKVVILFLVCYVIHDIM